MSCTTNGGADPGSQCVFPFVYEEITYQKCTRAENNGVPWCATEVDSDMNYLKWGNCGPNCSSGIYSL